MKLHLSGGTDHPHHRAGGETNRRHWDGTSAAGLPVRRCGVPRPSVAVPMLYRQRHERTAGGDPPSGGLAASGSGVAAERRLRPVPATTGGGGARLARLEQLGIRQARYFGRIKTKFQLYLAAAVASLNLPANQIGVVGNPGHDPDSIVASARIGGNLGVGRHLLPTWTLPWLRSPALALSVSPTRAFRPAF